MGKKKHKHHHGRHGYIPSVPVNAPYGSFPGTGRAAAEVFHRLAAHRA